MSEQKVAPENAAQFSQCAGRLAGMIPVITGWTPASFWRATPSEIAALFNALEHPASGIEPTSPLLRCELEQLIVKEVDDGR